MTVRILALALALALAACDVTAAGVSTSPSADDVAEARELPAFEAFAPCGAWIDDTAAAADARSLAGDPPDFIVFTLGHASCSDAQTMGEARWPGRVFTRRVGQHWRAYEAP